MSKYEAVKDASRTPGPQTPLVGRAEGFLDILRLIVEDCLIGDNRDPCHGCSMISSQLLPDIIEGPETIPFEPKLPPRAPAPEVRALQQEREEVLTWR